MQRTPLTASSRCFFSRITPENSIVLPLLRIELLTQPVRRPAEVPVALPVEHSRGTRWLDTKRPSMADRKHLAKWMMHSVEKQMGTYSKKAPVGASRSQLEEQGGGAYIRFSDM